MSPVNVIAKKMLAKILTQENLTIIHAGLRTATFDLKRRILTLPIWKDMSGDVYDLLLMHEVAHALYSSNIGPLLLPACEKIDPKYPKAAKRFINVVLDAKDERLIKTTYPGGRGSFIRGYADLIERNFFGTKNQDINDFGVVDRFNMYFKTGNLDIEFSEKEMDFIREIEKVMTFEEVVNICERLYQYAKEERDKKKAEEEEDGDEEIQEEKQESTEKKKSKKEDAEEDEELVDPDDESGDDSEDGEETEEEPGEETEDGTEESDETTEGEETDEDATDEETEESDEAEETKPTEDDVDDSPIESITDKTWEDTQKDLCDPNARPILYLGIPVPKLDKIIVPYRTVHSEIRKFYQSKSEEIVKHHTVEFDRFKQENKPVVAWLIKEFELHKSADQYARTKTSKTGIINLNRLSQYKFSDDLMLKVSAVIGGQNHALEIFVDWSGSMIKHVLGTIHQVINLATFARKEQIPFNAYTFGSLCRHSKQQDYNVGGHANMDEFVHRANDFAFFVGFKLRQILSSNMSASEFNEACINLLMLASGATTGYGQNRFAGVVMPGLPNNDCMGGTPLNEAMTAATYIIDEIRHKSNIQIVNVIFITDGEATTDGRYVGNKFGDCRMIDYGKEEVFLRDTFTHIDYPLGNDGMENTRQFINVLRNRTKVNVVGFFISGEDDKKIEVTVSKYCRTRWRKGEDEQEKIRKELRENNFLLVPDMGYSEFYLIPGGSKLRINLPQTQLNTMMSTNQMVTAMTKHGLEQRKQRVVLTRFIKLIS